MRTWIIIIFLSIVHHPAFCLATFFACLAAAVCSAVEALVPGLNVPYGIPFRGIRQEAVVGMGSKPERGPGWREMGRSNDKKFCFASLPGTAGKEFMGQVGALCWRACAAR